MQETCREKWYQSIKTEKLEHNWSFEFQTVHRLEARSGVFRFKIRAHAQSETQKAEEIPVSGGVISLRQDTYGISCHQSSEH